MLIRQVHGKGYLENREDIKQMGILISKQMEMKNDKFLGKIKDWRSVINQYQESQINIFIIDKKNCIMVMQYQILCLLSSIIITILWM